jgi:hypothetical protein
MKKNIVIEFNTKTIHKVFIYHLVIGTLRFKLTKSRPPNKTFESDGVAISPRSPMPISSNKIEREFSASIAKLKESSEAIMNSTSSKHFPDSFTMPRPLSRTYNLQKSNPNLNSPNLNKFSQTSFKIGNNSIYGAKTAALLKKKTDECVKKIISQIGNGGGEESCAKEDGRKCDAVFGKILALISDREIYTVYDDLGAAFLEKSLASLGVPTSDSRGRRKIGFMNSKLENNLTFAETCKMAEANRRISDMHRISSLLR